MAFLIRLSFLALATLLLLPLPANGQWVQAPGTGWIELQAAHHDTRERFDADGRVESLFDEEARSITTTVELSGAVGLFRGVDLWLQVPFHRLTFRDVVETRRSTGVGDPRFFLRVGPEIVGFEEAPPIALRAGVKLPAGDFPIDAEIIPLSEGQRDWELLLEVGHSFYPLPVYAMAWGGYRWREINSDVNRKPGDEWILHAATGGELPGSFAWKVAFDGLWGLSPERRLSSGIVLPLNRDRRRLLQVMPEVGREVGPGMVTAGARVPVAGRNLPAGPSFTIGYILSWDGGLW